MNSQKANARAVEFIARPGKSEQLREHICQTVTALLRGRIGFIQTIVLTSHEEPRHVMAMTLWSTEKGATHDPWEETPLVREILSPLIDVVVKVRTCEVDLTKATETERQATPRVSTCLGDVVDLQARTSVHR